MGQTKLFGEVFLKTTKMSVNRKRCNITVTHVVRLSIIAVNAVMFVVFQVIVHGVLFARVVGYPRPSAAVSPKK